MPNMKNERKVRLLESKNKRKGKSISYKLIKKTKKDKETNKKELSNNVKDEKEVELLTKPRDEQIKEN